MKKLVSLMLILGLMAVGVGACGESGGDAPVESPSPEASPSP